jgi:hypothetical protein
MIVPDSTGIGPPVPGKIVPGALGMSSEPLPGNIVLGIEIPDAPAPGTAGPLPVPGVPLPAPLPGIAGDVPGAVGVPRCESSDFISGLGGTMGASGNGFSIFPAGVGRIRWLIELGKTRSG